MRQIEVVNPDTNPLEERYRRFTFLCGDGNFQHEIRSHGIAPKTHPRVADLAAGDGSAAKILTEAGWDPKGITCVDLYRSPDPLVAGCQWKHLNLRELSEALRIKEPLPAEITALQGAFDVVVIVGAVGVFDSRNFYEQADRVCNFFADPKGKIICW